MARCVSYRYIHTLLFGWLWWGSFMCSDTASTYSCINSHIHEASVVNYKYIYIYKFIEASVVNYKYIYIYKYIFIHWHDVYYIYLHMYDYEPYVDMTYMNMYFASTYSYIDMTRSYTWHDASMCVTWLIYMCNMTHWLVWSDSFVCGTIILFCLVDFCWQSCMCLNTSFINLYLYLYSYSYLCMFLCVHACVCDMTYAWYDWLICVTWLVCVWDMTR